MTPDAETPDAETPDPDTRPDDHTDADPTDADHDHAALDDTAVLLRGVLAARADRVEPGPDGLAAIERRTEQRRRQLGRRRALVSAAAAVLAATGVVGGVAVLGNDDGADDRTEVAAGAGTEGPATLAPDTAGPAGETPGGEAPGGEAPGGEAPGGESPNGVVLGPDGVPLDSQPVVVWPLPTMSIAYDDPTAAALAFVSGYLGLEGGDICPRDPEIDGVTATVGVVHHGVCASTGSAEPFGPTTYVDLIRTDVTWVVIGSRSNAFEVTTDPEIGPHPTSFDATVSWTSVDAGAVDPTPAGEPRVELLPLASMTPVDSGPAPTPGQPYQTTLDAGVDAGVDDPGDPFLYVLVVTDGVTASTDIIYVGQD